nr:MAG TPA: hypothetical protein [Caudoviricetes sp.]
MVQWILDEALRQQCRGAFVIPSCLQFVSDPQNIMLCRVRPVGHFLLVEDVQCQGGATRKMPPAKRT